MKNDDKYIEILKWAFKKKESGFTIQELFERFDLNINEQKWVNEVFITKSNSDRRFFEIYFNDESVTPNKYYYSLNEKGISTVLDYYNSEDTKKLSKKSICVAIIAVAISVISLGITGYQTFLTRRSVEIATDTLDTTEKQIAKLNDPLFTIGYSTEDESFEIRHAENIKIDNVDWLVQTAYVDSALLLGDDVDPDQLFVAMESNGTKLRRDTILDHLVNQVKLLNRGIGPAQVKFYSECYDNNFPSNALHVKIRIYYKERGENELKHVVKYVYFDRIFSISPMVFDLDNIENPEIAMQFRKNDDFKRYIDGIAAFDWKQRGIEEEGCPESFSGFEVREYERFSTTY